eukprot:13821166-Ditylum_brightwellii.AAC.1
MKSSSCPLAFWDYCVERRSQINNMTAKGTFQLHGQNVHTTTTSEQDRDAKFSFNREVLGRVLGPAKVEGNKMTQWILKSNGN